MAGTTQSRELSNEVRVAAWQGLDASKAAPGAGDRGDPSRPLVCPPKPPFKHRHPQPGNRGRFAWLPGSFAPGVYAWRSGGLACLTLPGGDRRAALEWLAIPLGRGRVAAGPAAALGRGLVRIPLAC